MVATKVWSAHHLLASLHLLPHFKVWPSTAHYGHMLQWFPPVNIVPKEEVVGVWSLASDLEDLHEVMELPMCVADNHNWRPHVCDIVFARQQLLQRGQVCIMQLLPGYGSLQAKTSSGGTHEPQRWPGLCMHSKVVLGYLAGAHQHSPLANLSLWDDRITDMSEYDKECRPRPRLCLPHSKLSSQGPGWHHSENRPQAYLAFCCQLYNLLLAQELAFTELCYASIADGGLLLSQHLG